MWHTADGERRVTPIEEYHLANLFGQAVDTTEWEKDVPSLLHRFECECKHLGLLSFEELYAVWKMVFDALTNDQPAPSYALLDSSLYLVFQIHFCNIFDEIPDLDIYRSQAWEIYKDWRSPGDRFYQSNDRHLDRATPLAWSEIVMVDLASQFFQDHDFMTFPPDLLIDSKVPANIDRVLLGLEIFDIPPDYYHTSLVRAMMKPVSLSQLAKWLQAKRKAFSSKPAPACQNAAERLREMKKEQKEIRKAIWQYCPEVTPQQCDLLWALFQNEEYENSEMLACKLDISMRSLRRSALKLERLGLVYLENVRNHGYLGLTSDGGDILYAIT